MEVALVCAGQVSSAGWDRARVGGDSANKHSLKGEQSQVWARA